MGVVEPPQLFVPLLIDAVVSIMIATLKGGPGAPFITASEVAVIGMLGWPFSCVEKKFIKFNGTAAVCVTVSTLESVGSIQSTPRLLSADEQPSAIVGGLVTVISR